MMDQPPAVPNVIPPLPPFAPQIMPQANWQTIAEAFQTLAEETINIPNFVSLTFYI